jgi:hypothetical protein
MKPAALIFLVLLASAIFAPAGEAPQVETQEPERSSLKMGYELEGQYSYAGGASTAIGRNRSGDVSEQYANLRFLVTPRWGEGPIYRFGLGMQRYSFGLPANAVLPNTLQSVTAIVGLDFQLGDSWLMRVEVEPGLYSDFNDADGRDFNAPFIIGASYIASASLQFVGGVSVNVNRRFPVYPAVGLRWNFHGPWTLNAVLPTPRLEYAWSKALTVYAGADIKNEAFRVGSDFGEKHGVGRLDDAWVEYSEIRIGTGFTWKAAPGVSLQLEAGYLPYREFNFHRADLNMESDGGAAYGQVGFSAKF